ncbi:MAG: hypothetical protein ACREPH_04980 [Rhodanobacteraceae bacterium]
MQRLITIAICVFIAALPVAPAQAQTGTQDKYGFNIDIVLSPKTAATLAARGEQIMLFAAYFGDPKKSAEKHADEIGHIDLTRHDTTWWCPGKAEPCISRDR